MRYMLFRLSLLVLFQLEEYRLWMWFQQNITSRLHPNVDKDDDYIMYCSFHTISPHGILTRNRT